MSKNILVFGGSGQLGQCLKKVAVAKHIDRITFVEKSEGNVLDTNSINTLFDRYKPNWVINCAAYTAVDKAEDDIEMAREINKSGAMNIANCCNSHDAVMIHISTDFVFNGNKATPLAEDDATEPIGIYGLTKLEGEKAVASVLVKHYIVRTSWLYSEFANNFVKTMLKLATGRTEINVIADQVGTPTYAIDLAGALFDIIDSETQVYGTYHYSNEGVASWYDFAKSIFKIANIDIAVHPLKTAQYPTRAARPAYSVMDKNKIKENFNIKIPYWRDSLENCLNALHATQK